MPQDMMTKTAIILIGYLPSSMTKKCSVKHGNVLIRLDTAELQFLTDFYRGRNNFLAEQVPSLGVMNDLL